MEIGVIGRGHVARLLEKRLTDVGHSVVLGVRNPDVGGERFVSVAQAVSRCPVIINATPGAVSVAALTTIGPDLFDGKVLIDLANAVSDSLDLLYPNASLGQALQEALPAARVVKSMSTAAMDVIVEPGDLARGTLFVSGDDADAKDITASLLTDLGWPREHILDLGGIATARGPEHLFALIPALAHAVGGLHFALAVLKGETGQSTRADVEAVPLRMAAAMSRRDIDELLSNFADDFECVTPLHPSRSFRGIEHVRANYTKMFDHYPVLDARVVDNVVDGDQVWSEWEMLGTRADGVVEAIRGVAVIGVVDGRAAVSRFYLDPVDDGPLPPARTPREDAGAPIRPRVTR